MNEIVSKRIVTLREWNFQQSIPVQYSEIELKIPTYLEYVYLFEGVEKIQQESTTGYGAAIGSETTENHSKYFIRDLPAIQEEAFITNLDDYRTSIRFQLSHIRRPDGILDPFLRTWEEVAGELYDDQNLGQQISKKSSCNKLYEACKPVLDKHEKPRDKVTALYDFLAGEMRWIGRARTAGRFSPPGS